MNCWTSGPGLLTANVKKCRCKRGSMVNVPAVGFMQAMYWMLRTSLGISLLRSYLNKLKISVKGNQRKFWIDV